VAPKLPEALRLKRELENFRVKVTRSASETFGAEGAYHDDLVCAVMLAAWLAERHPPWGPEDIVHGPPRLTARLPPGTFLTGGTRPPPRW
jgi:hypothetical protein